MLQTFAVLALILGLFIAAAWLLRRLNGGQGLLAGAGPMRIVASLQTGPRERILLVEIEDTWLVVGIAPGQINTLHTLPKGTLPQGDQGSERPFGLWLRQFRNERRGPEA